MHTFDAKTLYEKYVENNNMCADTELLSRNAQKWSSYGYTYYR